MLVQLIALCCEFVSSVGDRFDGDRFDVFHHHVSFATSLPTSTTTTTNRRCGVVVIADVAVVVAAAASSDVDVVEFRPVAMASAVQ